MITQTLRERKITHHKSQRVSPNHSILPTHHTNNQESFSNPLLNFKKQMLSKLKAENFSHLKLDIQPRSRNIQQNLINQKKRIQTQIYGKKALLLPELDKKKREINFKNTGDDIKLQSRRMFDQVNKLYEIIKNDFNKATLHPKLQSKKSRDLATRESTSNRKRNKTSDSKPDTLSYRATIDVQTVRRKSITQNMKRDANKTISNKFPPPAMLFTFYPNQQQVNQFLQ